MRNFKFRYWDTFDSKEPKMIYFDFGKVSGGSVYPDISTVMQFTGLLDKCGKEIYEGDIVNAIGMYPSLVIFENGTFRLEGGSPSIIEDYEHYEGFEVIGNKYENK